MSEKLFSLILFSQEAVWELQISPTKHTKEKSFKEKSFFDFIFYFCAFRVFRGQEK